MKTIGIHPPAAFERSRRLLDGLTELEGVRFQPVEAIEAAPEEPLILLGCSTAEVKQAMSLRKRVFAFCPNDAGHESNEPVQFGTSTLLDPVLRGQRLMDSTAPSALDLDGVETVEVLASKGPAAVWARITSAGCTADLVAYAAPELGDGGYLFEHLRRRGFMPLLPLIHFVREAAGEFAWQRPPLRACFMFDDPNLHAASFGHIDYRKLLESARQHNYHVSFATIPLDGWFVHQPTAKLFRESADRFSFLIHGNNHTNCELAQFESEYPNVRLAAQALKRTARLEQVSGVNVARVMAAPHAACNDAMADALVRLGFEAACISRSAIMDYNPARQWPVSIGLNPAAFMGGGLPVIPRLGLLRDSETEIVLAAFLGQPVIMVGHHQDVSKGYGLLEQLAGFINRLGAVRWCNLQDMARSNFNRRIAGDTLVVRTFSRDVDVAVGDSIRTIVFDPAWKRFGERAEPVLILRGGAVSQATGENCVAIAVDGPERVRLEQPSARRIDYHRVPAPPMALWPFLRRLMAELRDRVQPLLPARRAVSGPCAPACGCERKFFVDEKKPA